MCAAAAAPHFVVNFESLCSSKQNIRSNFIKSFKIPGEENRKRFLDALHKCLYSATKFISIGLVEFIVEFHLIRKYLTQQEILEILRINKLNRTNMELNCFYHKKLLIMASIFQFYDQQQQDDSEDIQQLQFLRDLFASLFMMFSNFDSSSSLSLVTLPKFEANFIPLIHHIISRFQKLFQRFKVQIPELNFCKSNVENYPIYFSLNRISSNESSDENQIENLNDFVKFISKKSPDSKICVSIIQELLLHFVSTQNIDALDLLYEICREKFEKQFVAKLFEIILDSQKFYFSSNQQFFEEKLIPTFSSQYFPQFLAVLEKFNLFQNYEEIFISKFKNYQFETQLSLLVNICDPAILREKSSSNLPSQLISIARGETISSLLDTFCTMLSLSKEEEKEFLDPKCFFNLSKCFQNSMRSEASEESKANLLLYLISMIFFQPNVEIPQRIRDKFNSPLESSFDPKFRGELINMISKLFSSLFEKFSKNFETLEEILRILSKNLLTLRNDSTNLLGYSQKSQEDMKKNFEQIEKIENSLLRNSFLIFSFLEFPNLQKSLEIYFEILEIENFDEKFEQYSRFLIDFIKSESNLLNHFAQSMIFKFLSGKPKITFQTFLEILVQEILSFDQNLTAAAACDDLSEENPLEIISTQILLDRKNKSKICEKHVSLVHLEKLLIKILPMTFEENKLIVLCKLTNFYIETNSKNLKIFDEFQLKIQNKFSKHLDESSAEICDLVQATLNAIIDHLEDQRIFDRNLILNFSNSFYKILKYSMIINEKHFCSSPNSQISFAQIVDKISNFLLHSEEFFNFQNLHLLILLNFLTERKLFFELLNQNFSSKISEIHNFDLEKRINEKISTECSKLALNISHFEFVESNQKLSSNLKIIYSQKIILFITKSLIINQKDRSTEMLNNLSSALIFFLRKIENSELKIEFCQNLKFLKQNQNHLMRCSKKSQRNWKNLLQNL